MLPVRGRQYIDWMLSVWLERASHSDLIPAPPWRFSQCLVCRTWQTERLCAACLKRWRLSGLRCTRCAIDLPAHHHDTICTDCEDQSPEFDRAIAAVDYVGPWPELLAKLKFQRHTALAKPLGRLLADATQTRKGLTSLIVPVPLSTQRLRERGYNQSWLLARQVGRQLNITARTDVLQRRLHTSRLMSLTAEARAQQIREAFHIPARHHGLLQGRHVAIVDDVMTTGATLNACAQALLDAGACSVSAWVLARTPRPRQSD